MLRNLNVRLKMSIKRDAFQLIKNVSLESPNYDIVFARLKAKYLNHKTIKHTLLQSVLFFKYESGPRYCKVLSVITALAWYK